MSGIKAIVMDVDGTLTDGKIYISDNGELMKAFNVKDGYGIKDILSKYNVMPVIVTGRSSIIVKKRCDEMGVIHLFQGVSDKVACLADFLKTKNMSFENIAYIGDDDNDLPVMRKSGLVGCPNDSSEAVKSIAQFISTKSGGNGAVREFIDWLVTNGYFIQTT